MLKTLLLDSSYQTISFISIRKLIKLVVKDKVDIISSWDRKLRWGAGDMFHPSVVRLKHYVQKHRTHAKFNRRGVFRRDMYVCQYCACTVSPSKATLDHVLPLSKGGKGTWENCVTSCKACNEAKANRTPEQANMKLLRKPGRPKKTLVNEYMLTRPKHDDWNLYFPEVELSQHRDHT